MWFAGIDWADTHHDVVVVDAAGTRVGRRRFAHSAEGVADLVTFLKGIGDRATQPDQVACIIETTHGLLITAMLEAGLPVYPVNPKTLERLRKPSGAKTDGIDAQLLARKGRNDLDTLPRLTPDSPGVQELKVLTRDQNRLIQTQTRLVNQIIACLKQYYPVALTLVAKVAQRVTLAFLRTYPTVEAARTASLEELDLLLRAGHHPHPQEKAQAIWTAVHQPQLYADPITTRTKARLLSALLNQLQPVLDAIAGYDDEIERCLDQHPDGALFRSLPGAGPRLAPRLLAEWGDDRGRYASAAAIQALAGTAPVTFQSGNFRKVRRRNACIKPLRNTLQQVAWHSTRDEPWAQAYYARKRSEGKRHAMALRALANQWVRIIYGAWHGYQCYDRERFLTARRAYAPDPAA